MARKTVVNQKTCDDIGWQYLMIRIVNGKHYGLTLCIAMKDTHRRKFITARVVQARKQLRYNIRNDQAKVT